jgi:hypothetical protein
LLLFHQLPQKPAYLRVKIWRKLAGLGAVAVKGSIYVLPESPDTLEDFQWVLKEINAGGGEGSVVSANFVEGMTDREVVALFSTAREADYAELAVQARAVTKGDGDARCEAATRLRKRLADLTKIDFFDAPGRQGVEELIAAMEEQTSPLPATTLDPKRYRRRTWVTREHVFVDRIASAWLVATVIDPQARFRFISPGESLRANEIGLDFPEAEFTHVGDRCTFEVLLDRFALDAPGLRQVAEIIHDLDCKDGKYGRPEAAGTLAAITGMTRHVDNDERRIERGGHLLADLQAYFAAQSGRPRRAIRAAHATSKSR